MEILITTEKSSLKPIRTYETSFVWTGSGRYNTEKKTFDSFSEDTDGKIWFISEYCPTNMVLSRSYTVELVTVEEYADGSWSENNHYFRPQQQK